MMWQIKSGRVHNLDDCFIFASMNKPAHSHCTFDKRVKRHILLHSLDKLTSL